MQGRTRKASSCSPHSCMLCTPITCLICYCRLLHPHAGVELGAGRVQSRLWGRTYCFQMVCPLYPLLKSGLPSSLGQPFTLPMPHSCTGELDRARIGALVFKDSALRKKLNEATHVGYA